jgi:hypothetical protein
MSLDLNNLKESIQGIFQAANTTTATRDLSSGLTDRVVRVLKVNPERIPIQATWIPFVTVFIDAKEIELTDFAVNQLTAKRKGKISVKVVGVAQSFVVSDDEADSADDECEDLMENIEEILRGSPTLGGVATWSYPSGVTYHNRMLDEDFGVRAGILSLETEIFY